MSSFPIRVPVDVAWGEMDSLGHVNNIVYFRYFENARIAYFDRVGLKLAGSRFGPILASTSCNYRLPLSYPDQVEVRTGISRIGKSSFTMLYEVESRAQQAIVAEGEGVIVFYDYQEKKSTPLPPELLASIERLEKG